MLIVGSSTSTFTSAPHGSADSGPCVRHQSVKVISSYAAAVAFAGIRGKAMSCVIIVPVPDPDQPALLGIASSLRLSLSARACSS